MKKVLCIKQYLFLLIIVSLALIMPSNAAAEIGRINVKGKLNVRQEPTTKSPVIYQLTNGEEVELVDTVGDWVKISVWNDYGYVKSQYIQRNYFAQGKSFIQFTDIEDILLPWERPYKVWMTSTLLVMALVVLLIGGRLVDNDNFLPAAILSTIFSIAIIVYVCYVGSNATWFLDYKKTGWGLLILNGILFLFLIIAHFVGVWGVFACLKHDFDNYQRNLYHKYGIIRDDVNLTLGITALALVFIAIVICTFFNNDYLWWIIGVFALLQIIQTVMVYRSCGFWGTFMYVIAVLASFLLLIPTAIVGAIATIIVLVLAIINAAPAAGAVIPTSMGSSSSSSSSSNKNDDSFDSGSIGESFSGPCIRDHGSGKTAHILKDEGGGYVRTDQGRFYVDSNGNAKKV